MDFPLTRQQVKRPLTWRRPKHREQLRNGPGACPPATKGTEALFRKEKGQPSRWPRETTIFIVLLGASIADHLQARNAEIAILLFLGGILNLSFLLFLFRFSLRFSAGRPGHRYLVAKVVFQLNRAAT